MPKVHLGDLHEPEHAKACALHGVKAYKPIDKGRMPIVEKAL